MMASSNTWMTTRCLNSCGHSLFPPPILKKHARKTGHEPQTHSQPRARFVRRIRPGEYIVHFAKGSFTMIPREILKKIRQIELRTNRIVTETLAGQYHSVFKGQGMNFDEVREYQPGDDVRAIDWNVTARMNHPFIKKFVEERELTLMLVVDVSGSGLFGSRGQSKRELAAEIASVLPFSATRGGNSFRRAKAAAMSCASSAKFYFSSRSGAGRI